MLSVAAEPLALEGRAREASASSVEAVCDLLAEKQLAATWCSPSPIRSPLAARIVAGKSRQEIGLAVGTSTRERFAQVVRQETLTARAGGVTVSTVFVDGTLPADRFDLLTKYGITAVSAVGQPVPTTRGGANKLWRASRWLLPMAAHAAQLPQNLRWGLWRMPAAVHLASDGAWRVRHAVDSVVATGGLLHLHVDLLTGGSRVLSDLESVTRQVESHAARGRLTTQSIATVVADLSRPRVSAPACSILRKRAA